jgi:putative Mg2+ transporter-C (MgtC) family protein
VRNITTAATVWVTAALGLACAVADWRILGVGFALAALLLVFGKRLERQAEKVFGRGLPPVEDD